MALKQHKEFNSLHLIEHPLIQHKLALLRDVKTISKEFRKLVKEIALLLAYEATRNLPVITKTVKTPNESCKVSVLEDEQPVILPILRAGIGMIDGFLTLMPFAKVGHIGIFRDEKTLEPHCYYFKIPPRSKDRQFFVCDPMLATGGSAIAAINQLKQEEIHKIVFICIIASPQGIKKVTTTHPKIPIIAASLDRELNNKGYILPGMGDAGDRMFDTL
ncbi:MAG: uracil phosphoribosyltransferase [Coxiella sp. DG_40]|nr:MAG: uracil phosphoribosyltransferase [Coxiella sp. DG_40]